MSDGTFYGDALGLLFVVDEGTEFSHFPCILRKDFWGRIEIDERAVSVGPTLEGRDGAAH